MRAGFNARSAAIMVVEDTKAVFTTMIELRDWLNSETVGQLEQDEHWPSKETRDLWTVFTHSFKTGEKETWHREIATIEAAWRENFTPIPGTPVRMFNDPSDKSLVLSPECDLIATVSSTLNPNRKGLLRANITSDAKAVMLHYLGPKDLFVH
jgi:hypothetical protein